MRFLPFFLILSFPVFADSIVSPDKNNPFPDPLYDEKIVHVYTKDEMFNITVEAAEKRPDVALLLRNGEQWFWRNAKHVGVTPDVLAPVGAVAAPLIAHKVSTRPIHIDWRPAKNLTLRPDFDYYFQTKETRLAFTIAWKF